MKHYWFNRHELLKKAKKKYDNDGAKERAVEYYKDNKDVLKEKARNRYKNLTEEEKELKRQYSKDSIINYKKIIVLQESN